MAEVDILRAGADLGQLRQLVFKDVESVRKFTNTCLGMEYPSGFFIQFICNKDCVCLYLVDRSDPRLIVGSISGRIEPICSLPSSLVGHIYTLAVGDSYRLRGVGRLLVGVFEDYLVRYAVDVGTVASALKLETTAQNVGARAFYERLGFSADDAPRSVYGYGASGIALVRPVSSPPTTACL